MPGQGLRVFRRRAEDISPITFSINGRPYTVYGEYDLTTTLNDFIRDGAGLCGTKVMCKEGGCGCCAVTVAKQEPGTDKEKTFSINSCLCPLYSVDGWQITTVEGLGSSKKGFHPVQKRIAEFNGTQCGYCTPGMVMNMYGILNKNPTPTQQEIEDQFGGNICRCTGYRPILDAMKSFAKDSDSPEAKCIDIEDLKICPHTGDVCQGKDEHANGSSANGSSANGSSANGSGPGFILKVGGKSWYRPTSLKTLSDIFRTNRGKSCKPVYGNTESGIYKEEPEPDVYIDLHDVNELFKIEKTANSFMFGGGLSLSDMIDTLEQNQSEKGYGYFTNIAEHLKLIGNVLVRNAGSWAGNIMIKHAHPDFPSDVFTPLEAAGARVYVMDGMTGSVKSQPLLDLVQGFDMKGKIITSIELFRWDQTYKYRSYKIMPRAQNAHAHVNAGFHVTVQPKSLQVLGKPSLVFGGIDRTTHHAVKTETFLTGKNLQDVNVIREAAECLRKELNPDYDQLLASPEYRRNLAVNLFYKFILSVNEGVSPTCESGGQILTRPVSRGQREFPAYKIEWPLKQAMPKLSAPVQASGEAEYINDMPPTVNELFGAFVLTTVGCGTIDTIDPSQALMLPGVVDFVTVKDIPGENNSLPAYFGINFTPQELFCSGEVKYAGQAVGFLLADSQGLADHAAKKVKITYKDVKPAIVTIQDAIRHESYHANPMMEHRVGDPEGALGKSKRRISGEVTHKALYHFYMENQVSLAVPAEERMDVYAAGQGTDFTQAALALVLGQPLNYFQVVNPRVGGSFGGKVLGTLVISAAVAVAAYKHNRSVKTSVNMSTNMKHGGKRPEILAKYEVGFDDDGRIDVISMDVYANAGYTANFQFVLHEIMMHVDGGYHVPNWRIKLVPCKTNSATGQPMRGPGPYPAGFIVESILEQVSKDVNRTPADVKQLNLYKEGQKDHTGNELKNCTLRRLWTELRNSSEFDKRKAEIESFNKSNKWTKRAITMTPAKYGFMHRGYGYTVDVSIYYRDGTVTVSQGGVEMGQGLYTKTAQAVASVLGIPVELVKVRHVNSHNAANNNISGGSMASELCVASAVDCCKILKERIDPISAKHPDYDWKNIVKTCFMSSISLSAKHTYAPEGAETPGHFKYFSYSVAVSEVELDVLTGQSLIRRVDILFDSGQSLNPDIDIGQIEGAYLMGVGGYMSEEVKYDQETGSVLTDGTWEYKPPGAKDIPVDWRIKLLADSQNPVGVRGSKATGEPPILLSSGVFYALKQAMETARKEITGDETWQPAVAPLTVERIQLGCGFNISKFTL